MGSELGGRNEAILGGAIGGALGTAIVTRDRRQQHDHYAPAPRHYQYADHGRWHERRPPGPPHCPPGLAKQGRC
ncbi:MAG: hypothetical protein ACNA7W_03585 [Pseudomonadales bacterium]